MSASRNPSRRFLLGAGAALVPVAAVPALALAQPDPDAGLVAASAQLIRTMAVYDATDEAGQGALEEVENEAIRILAETPASAATGINAKAQAFLRRGFHLGYDSEDAGDIAKSLCRDLLAGDTGFLARLDADHAARRVRDAALMEKLFARPHGGTQRPECFSCGSYGGDRETGALHPWHAKAGGDASPETRLLCEGCVDHARALIAGVAK